MTVRELIVQLMQHDPDRPVVVNMGRNELANGREVNTVVYVEVISTVYGMYRETLPGSLKDQVQDEDGERVTDIINISS